MPTAEKVELVNHLADRFKQTQSAVLTDFKGMTVDEMSDLRTQLRDQQVEIKVLKNRLLKLALAQAECEALDDVLIGNTAVAFGVDDPAAPAKVLVKYAKANDKLVIKGGLLEGKRLDEDGVRQLSEMPSRPELLSRIAGDFKAPAGKMAMAFNATVLKLAYAFQALAEKKEEAGEAA